jgi:cation-dependent mannose-6-phosphate receptor
VLQYSGGSPCPDLDDLDRRDGALEARFGHQIDEEAGVAARKEKKRHKSATFAFLCDRDPGSTEATVSFVGAVDECAYFFKVRSQHACAGVEPHKPGSVGPGGVFVIILVVALLVYFVGGVFYQRTVSHARGWRQLPNYSFWSGIWSFLQVCALPTFRGRCGSPISCRISSSF